MNKLVLIGNGFDLAHGLNTRYLDFILWYLNKAFRIYTAKRHYDDGLMTIKETRPFSYFNFHSIEDFKKFVIEYDFQIKYKHGFMKNLIEEYSNSNWVDIESLYFYFLKISCKTAEDMNVYKNMGNETGLTIMNRCFEYLKEQLIEYLLTVDNLKVIDEDIKTMLSNELLSMIDSKYPLPQLLFLNFNYTSTLEMYIPPELSDIIKINYIHGKLNDKHNPIIFGYGDETDTYYEKIEQLNNNEFLRHFKSFGYFNTNNYRNLSTFMSQKYFNVYIMGHSCGLSDRVLLSNIFEHKNCKGIKIFYHQKDENSNDFFEKTQEISRHFSAANKAKMRTIIVPFSESVPLKKYKPS